MSLLAYGEQRPVTSFFNLQLGLNEGVSFGMLSGTFAGHPLVLSAITLLVTLLLAVWMLRTANRSEAVSLALIVGGALSNILDRLRVGAVIDYLDLHVGGLHWPAFNLADAAIVLGVLALLAKSLLPTRRADHRPPVPR